MVNILDGCQYFVQRKRRPIIREVQVKISYIKLLSLASVFDGVHALYYGDLCAVLPWRLVLPQGFFFYLTLSELAAVAALLLNISGLLE